MRLSFWPETRYVEEILELHLQESELAGLRHSADSVRGLIEVMGI